METVTSAGASDSFHTMSTYSMNIHSDIHTGNVYSMNVTTNVCSEKLELSMLSGQVWE